MIRTHTQSNSNAELSPACKAGKTQSYFSNQNGDMLRERAANLQGERALTLGSTLNSAKHVGLLTATSAALFFHSIQLNKQ